MTTVHDTMVEHEHELEHEHDREHDLEREQQLEFDPLDVGSGPKRLSHYVLLDKLGHGGMGVVYAAYDESLDRKVAIKLLRPRTVAENRKRLVREAQAMARLSHPNVVQIYEIGDVAGRTFVVMEFVDGLTLREWLAAHRRSRAGILDAFVAAGRGLAAAHQKGLIHRDFKPENVMLDRDGRVLVMDFGLARGFGRPGEDLATTRPSSRPAAVGPDVDVLVTDLTAEGTVMGTPAYMAPEQIEGRPTDHRSDQFSFCVALWEALFEKRPFAAGSLSELSDVVSEGKFEATDRSKVPGWLRKVLRRGLAADPDRRWPTMTTLLDVLERDPTRRRRAAFVATAAAVTIAAVLAVRVAKREDAPIAWTPEHVRADLSTCTLAGREIEVDWNLEVRDALARSFAATKLEYADAAWTRTAAWADRYALEWTQLRARSCFAARTGGDRDEQAEVAACLEQRRAGFVALLEAWREADAQTVTLALTAAASLPPVARCTDAIWRAQQLAPPPELEVEVARRRAPLERAMALRLAGRFDAGLGVAQAASREAEALGWRPLAAEAALAVGRLHDELGDYAAARAALDRAYLDAVAGGHDLLALEAATWLTLVVGDKLGRAEDGARWGRIGASLVERLQLRDSVHEAGLLYAIGLIEDHLGEDQAAIASLARALAITRRELGPTHPEVARMLNGLGGVYWARGEYDEALATQVRSLEIVEAVLGPQHPEVARSLSNMGQVLGRLGEHDEALAAQRRALAIREAALGSSHPDVATTLNAIGVSHALAGDYRAALAAHRRALAIVEAELGAAHPVIASTQAKIAAAQLGLGELDAARRSAGEALAGLDDGPSLERTTVTLTLARIDERAGRIDAARELLSGLLVDLRAAHDSEHPQVLEVTARLEALAQRTTSRRAVVRP